MATLSPEDTKRLRHVAILLRRVAPDEILARLGWPAPEMRQGDGYYPCPDPSHVDEHPSFHIRLVDDIDSTGVPRIGRYNCWSHPHPGLSGMDFFRLVAHIRADAWNRHVTAEERLDAMKWVRKEFLGRDKESIGFEADLTRRLRREANQAQARGELTWPVECIPMASADRQFIDYMEGRGIPLERAMALGALAIASYDPIMSLKETVPAVMFPIKDMNGKVANWFARAINKVPSRYKGRYCPGMPVGTAGLIWSPDKRDISKPVAICEGIFSSERARTASDEAGWYPGNFVAALGGTLTAEQAKHLMLHPGVLVLADSGVAGAKFAAKVAERLGSLVPVWVKQCPDPTDPGNVPMDFLVDALRSKPPIPLQQKTRIRLLKKSIAFIRRNR